MWRGNAINAHVAGIIHHKFTAVVIKLCEHVGERGFGSSFDKTTTLKNGNDDNKSSSASKIKPRCLNHSVRPDRLARWLQRHQPIKLMGKRNGEKQPEAFFLRCAKTSAN